MIQNGILLTSFPFRRITSCIVGVTGLNQDTKTTELLCGMCCQKKHSKNHNIVKAKAQVKVPWQAFACCHFWLLLGVFPYFLLVTEVTMCKSNLQFIKYLSFLFFFGIYTNHFFFLLPANSLKTSPAKMQFILEVAFGQTWILRQCKPTDTCPVYLSICCVKYCFHHKNIGTTIQKSSGLFCVGLYQLIKG